MSLDDCVSQANVGEVLPGTTTPLTLTIIGYGLDSSVTRQVSGVQMSGLFLRFVRFVKFVSKVLSILFFAVQSVSLSIRRLFQFIM